jgi:hypothetical protein
VVGQEDKGAAKTLTGPLHSFLNRAALRIVYCISAHYYTKTSPKLTVRVTHSDGGDLKMSSLAYSTYPRGGSDGPDPDLNLVIDQDRIVSN